MVGSFGSGARNPCGSKRLVEETLKIAAPPHRGVAREEITLLVDGVPQEVEVVRQPRHRGGQQGYWRCPTCETLREALYLRDGVLQCRCCHRLIYRSRVLQKHRAVLRAAKLRHKLHAPPGLLSAVPPRPAYWRRDYWARTIAELAAAESVLAEMLRGTVKALERRKGRLHGPR